ncbi:uncharacterized protein [Aristolochia californica]|uniref:uncharacterized protein isoform X1 n=1 Tax=Aristolochia californica TaxID=171875 RepID=UPI0035DA1F48
MVCLTASRSATTPTSSNFIFSSPLLPSFASRILPRNLRVVMSSSTVVSPSLPPLPEKRIVLGCGGLGLDYLVMVAAFPKPDHKIRSTNSLVQGGGNAGNALTGAARLGLAPRLIAKVSDDAQGRNVVAELETDGIDTSFIVVSKEGNTPFTYVIVDDQTKTRTCIHTPGYPPLVPDDLSQSSMLAALDEVSLVYFDVRFHDTALRIAKEAANRKIPILIDSERKREGLDELLNLATYVVCSQKFPQEWTGASSVPSALLSMLLRLPNIKFVIVTLGEEGCIMLERSLTEYSMSEEMDIDELLVSLKKKIDTTNFNPTCISSETVMRLRAGGVGAVNGMLHVGTAEKILPSELIDTTGAGDAFIGAILYAICANMPPGKMLPFAAQVAAAGCRALGARTGLPHRTDPRLAQFLQ